MNKNKLYYRIIFKNKFKEITLAERGIILNKRRKIKKEALFSELDQIYISVHKMNLSNKFLIILVLLFAGLYTHLYLQVDIPIILAYLTVIIFILEMNKFRNYTLKIRLKNGKTFEKKIAEKLKQEAIDLINEI
ncbi:hypothetical protein DR871_000045 [Flavobacterium petrolei]|uniref:Uncharacterized protein n=1 Tax=Flavobacterium petrolei TaxID=2259594 RepID=A0A482TX46_9FLAO|nr:hypothetical protein [Flavobacterium petrolei]RYJ52482.1 hypothetical protein DR871_000045 [Flavobacterium petrolei]